MVGTVRHGAIVVPAEVLLGAAVAAHGAGGASPAGLAGEQGVRELGAAGVGEGRAAVQGDVVEAEVPDGGVDHAVRREGHDGPDDGAGEHVVPVVVLVDGQGAADQARAQDRRVDGDQLPHGRVVVGKDLELGVEVEVQVDEAREGGRGVARRHRLERVVDLLGVARADLGRVVDAREARPVVAGALDARRVAGAADVGLADVEEVRAQAADEPLDEDLEHGRRDERVEQADDAVVDVPEGAHPDLADEDHDDGDEGGQQRGGHDGDDFLAQRVGEFGVHDLAVRELHGEGAGGGRVGHVDTEAEGAHGGHGEDVEPRELQPLAEGGTLGHRVVGAGVVGGAVLLAAAKEATAFGPGSSGLGRLLAGLLVEKTHLCRDVCPIH